MYDLLGITLLKSLRPIFRKNVMESIDTYSYLLLNTIFICIFIVLYFYYLHVKEIKFTSIVDNCKNMNCIQLISMILISFLTVLSTVILMNQNNISSISGTIMKSLSTIILVLIGIFLYREKYSYIQLYGVLLTIVGIFFISSK